MIGYLVAGLALLNLVSFGMGWHYGGKTPRAELSAFKQRVEAEGDRIEAAWLARLNDVSARAEVSRRTAKSVGDQLTAARKLVSDRAVCDLSPELVRLWHGASSAARDPAVTGERDERLAPVPPPSTAAVVTEAELAKFVDEAARAFIDVTGQKLECIARYNALRGQLNGQR